MASHPLDLSGTWLDGARKMVIRRTGKDPLAGHYVAKYVEDYECDPNDGGPVQRTKLCFEAVLTGKRLDGAIVSCAFSRGAGGGVRGLVRGEFWMNVSPDGNKLEGQWWAQHDDALGPGWRDITFIRHQFPTRFTASVATVSEIPENSLPGFSETGLQLTEQLLGTWNPHWTKEYPKRDTTHPLDAVFSDSHHFRFMHVLSAFIESPDQRSISASGFLPEGPGMEHTTPGQSVLGAGAIEYPVHTDNIKITVDKTDVMIFESVYGGRTWAPTGEELAADAELVIKAPLLLGVPEILALTARGFPPIWTALRIGLGADGQQASEMYDYSYFPQHFVFDDGVYQESTVEDVQDWLRFGWGQLKPGDGSVIFDPDAAEAWWRKRTAPSADPWQEEIKKVSTQGNPFNK